MFMQQYMRWCVWGQQARQTRTWTHYYNVNNDTKQQAGEYYYGNLQPFSFFFFFYKSYLFESCQTEKWVMKEGEDMR